MAEGAGGGGPRGSATAAGGEGERGAGGGPASESWELFSNWACCVCVVTFDLELGQALEVNWAVLYMAGNCRYQHLLKYIIYSYMY